METTPEILMEAAVILDEFAEKGAVSVVGPGELLDKCPGLIVSDL